MIIKIKKLTDKAVMPLKAHKTDAGFDMTATSKEIDKYGNFVYHTDIAIEIPIGYVGLLFPRSSNCKKELLLTNSVGVIDSGYRGEVTAKFAPYRFIGGDAQYEVGDRIAQLIIMPIPDIELIETDNLSESDRGEGGYGSSGK